MKAESRKIFQLVLAIALVLAGIRLVLIYRGRHAGAPTPSTAATPAKLEPDYYVVPKKLYAYDLKSARQIIGRPAWVKEGYRYTYYAFDAKRRRTDFHHEAGLLGPIERLDISDVLADVSPGNPDQRQVMAVFQKKGNTYAVPVGAERGGEFRSYIDEIFFIEDPHQLYKHWPAEVWAAIEQHELKPGMSELQASFAAGMGVPQASRETGARVLQYPNGGNPLTVTYRNGKAAAVSTGSGR